MAGMFDVDLSHYLEREYGDTYLVIVLTINGTKIKDRISLSKIKTEMEDVWNMDQ